MSAPSLTAIVFDLDGTLIDSLGDIAAAMNEALAACGRPGHAVDDYRAFVGAGVGVLAARALGAAAGAPLQDAVVSAFRGRYAARLLEATRPYPGVAALLDGLRARGVGAAVLTNKPQPAAERLVEALLGAWPWAVADHGLPRKPDPAGAREALRALGVAPTRALLVGDSDIDVNTARAAGLRSVGAAWGFRGPDELRAAGADVIVARPEDVLDLL